MRSAGELLWDCRFQRTAAARQPSRREVLWWGVITAGTVGPTSLAFAAGRGRAGPFAGIDRDGDGTIDPNEAKQAAGLLFDRLDRKHTGRVSRAQLGRKRVGASEFSCADRDHDGTLSRGEYLALVEREFKAADRDHDGTVSSAEFHFRTGLPLGRLLYSLSKNVAAAPFGRATPR